MTCSRKLHIVRIHIGAFQAQNINNVFLIILLTTKYTGILNGCSYFERNILNYVSVCMYKYLLGGCEYIFMCIACVINENTFD